MVETRHEPPLDHRTSIQLPQYYLYRPGQFNVNYNFILPQKQHLIVLF